MLNRRILTACSLIPLVFLLIFFAPYWLFAAVLLIALAVAGFEWAKLSMISNSAYCIGYIAILLVVTIAAYLIVPFHVIFIFALICWLFAFIMIFLFPRGKQFWQKQAWLRLLIGLFVLVPFVYAVDYIWLQKNGAIWLSFILIVIWSTDTAAYFTGKRFGKTKLAPLVSPKKTWQGLYGGVLGGLLAYIILGLILRNPIFFTVNFFLLMLCSIGFSIVGDLAESMVKRFAEVKDSGQLLPGHGGILDRIDSLTAAMPIFAMGLWLLS